ncbi:MAG: hypothetical protein MUF70_05275 [Myxococcota bacterium]|jgi:hypothetical protein|nr:hypothetical protein [Myxococcota bacterium]
MTDEVLLVFGCGVTFLALGGAYIYLRTHMLDTPLVKRVVSRRRGKRALPAESR